MTTLVRLLADDPRHGLTKGQVLRVRPYWLNPDRWQVIDDEHFDWFLLGREQVEPVDERDDATYALVYLRPDGWWSAGVGWKSVDAARTAGREHNWRGADWDICSADRLVAGDEGELHLPAGEAPGA